MSPTPPNTLRQDASARSPFAGCAILIAALAVMVFLIGFSVVTLFRQFNEIAKFTAEKPVPVEVSPLENQEAGLNNLAERVEAFRQQLGGVHRGALLHVRVHRAREDEEARVGRRDDVLLGRRLLARGGGGLLG